MKTTEKRSGFLKLKGRDFWKGLVVAVLTAGINSLYQVFSEATTFSTINWQLVAITSVTALIGYLLKNFFTNENGQLLKK